MTSKIDIFLIEADYALKYVDSDYVLDVKTDIGLTDSDLAGQYQYTKDIVSVDGSQRGTTWQATPGLFAYRRSIAKACAGHRRPHRGAEHACPTGISSTMWRHKACCQGLQDAVRL